MFLGSSPSFFFTDPWLWPLIVARGGLAVQVRPCVFPAMPGPKMGQQSTLMVSGQHTFLQNGLLQWSITDGVLALQQIPPPGLEPGLLG